MFDVHLVSLLLVVATFSSSFALWWYISCVDLSCCVAFFPVVISPVSSVVFTSLKSTYFTFYVVIPQTVVAVVYRTAHVIMAFHLTPTCFICKMYVNVSIKLLLKSCLCRCVRLLKNYFLKWYCRPGFVLIFRFLLLKQLPFVVTWEEKVLWVNHETKSNVIYVCMCVCMCSSAFQLLHKDRFSGNVIKAFGFIWLNMKNVLQSRYMHCVEHETR